MAITKYHTVLSTKLQCFPTSSFRILKFEYYLCIRWHKSNHRCLAKDDGISNENSIWTGCPDIITVTKSDRQISHQFMVYVPFSDTAIHYQEQTHVTLWLGTFSARIFADTSMTTFGYGIIIYIYICNRYRNDVYLNNSARIHANERWIGDFVLSCFALIHSS